MANQLSGRIHHIGQAVQMTTKNGNPFTKRELVLDTTRYDPYTGERSAYDNYALFEFSNDNTAQLDGLRTGQVVTVYFTVEGRKVKNEQTGEPRYFNSLRGYKVTVRQQGQAQAPPQPAPQPIPQPQTYAQPAPSNYGDLPF